MRHSELVSESHGFQAELGVTNIQTLFLRQKRISKKQGSGDYSVEVIPDPIPNSEVKLYNADGTCPYGPGE